MTSKFSFSLKRFLYFALITVQGQLLELSSIFYFILAQKGAGSAVVGARGALQNELSNAVLNPYSLLGPK